MTIGRTVAAANASVIAGRIPSLAQRGAPAQCQIGKAPTQNTAHAQILAADGISVSTKKIAPTPPSSEPRLNSSTKPLTDRQRLALNFIADHIRSHGFPPTYREIGEAMSIRSTNGVNDHLRALERKGYIRRDEMLSRSIRVVGLNMPKSEESTAPPPAITLIQVDREVLARTLAKLEALEDWIPRPVAERYEDAIADLRTAMLRGST